MASKDNGNEPESSDHVINRRVAMPRVHHPYDLGQHLSVLCCLVGDRKESEGFLDPFFLSLSFASLLASVSIGFLVCVVSMFPDGSILLASVCDTRGCSISSE